MQRGPRVDRWISKIREIRADSLLSRGKTTRNRTTGPVSMQSLDRVEIVWNRVHITVHVFDTSHASATDRPANFRSALMAWNYKG